MYEGGIRYTFTGNLALFAGAQRSVRIANLDELNPFNPPIDPQTGHSYTVGASWSQGIQHSTLTLWRANIDNEIVYDPGTLTNRNLDDPTIHKGNQHQFPLESGQGHHLHRQCQRPAGAL